MTYGADAERFMCKPPVKWKSTADPVCYFYDADTYCLGMDYPLHEHSPTPILSAEACYEVSQRYY